MTPEELAAELEQGERRPAYLLAGTEPLLVEEALAAIRAAVLGEAASDFDLDRVEGARATPASLLDALRTVPVLASSRLIWLRDPPVARPAGRALLEASADLIAAAAAASNVLVVTLREARPAPWVRAFSKPAAVVACDPPRGARALVSFVRAEARRQGVRLGPGAAERLAERIGPQLLMVRNELAKAALFAGPGEEVTVDHVAAAASDVADEPIWELTDAIGAGKTGDALATLARLLRSGARAPQLLGSLATHFRKLLRVRSGEEVPGSPFVRQKLERQARRYPVSRLVGCLAVIQQTDEALKGKGGLSEGLALERLVLSLSS